MELRNQDRISLFGHDHDSMDAEAPHAFIDARHGRLFSHLDMRIVQRWVLPALSPERRADLRILDVGAGKGRMTRRFARIARRCVAIEPYPPFFDALKASSTEPNVEARQSTLIEYAESADETFDLIFLSGVFNYLDDSEAEQSMRALQKLLRPSGFALLRDFGIENQGGGPPPFGSVIADEANELLLRPPRGMFELFKAAGFRCARWRRAYPMNVPWALRERWPNALTNLLWHVCSAELCYPLWAAAAAMNLPHRNIKCYFAYLLQSERDGASS